VPRQNLHDGFLRRISSGQSISVLWGTPGRGKNIYLSFLTSVLRKAKVPVIRHHYFLSPDDTTSDHFSFVEIAHSLMDQIVFHYPEAVKSKEVEEKPYQLSTWLEICGRHFAAVGKPFIVIIDGLDHRILTMATYIGVHQFNRRDSRTGEQKPPDQWEKCRVPALVTIDQFEQVRATLAARSPKKVSPRLVGNPTLLTGIARCGTCGGGMTLRPGKSGRYRYYTCAGCAQKGPTACAGRSINMAALDGLVLDNMTDKLLVPDRLAQILEAYLG
jgi:Recombinase zinc beta ribbon domain